MKSEYVLIHAAPIKHYGIKGQKKGVRRFQLDNGQLTAAGKARYYEENKNGGRPYTTPYDYESPEEKAKRAMKNARMAPMLASFDRFNKAYDKIGGSGHVAMENASKAAGINGRALTGAYGKKVGKTRPSAPSVPAVDSKTPWGKRASAVASTPASTPATKKETKDNLGNNGGRPYSTPYTQTVASGRKKNVTGTTNGASANKSSSINAAKKIVNVAKKIGEDARIATAFMNEMREKDIEKTTNVAKKIGEDARIATAFMNEMREKSGNSGTNKQLASPAKVDKDKLSSRGNEKTRDNVIKVGADLADIASDRAKQIDAITKTQKSLEAASKASKQMDNGAVDTLKKKKDLVKIKSGKNTRR